MQSFFILKYKGHLKYLNEIHQKVNKPIISLYSKIQLNKTHLFICFIILFTLLFSNTKSFAKIRAINYDTEKSLTIPTPKVFMLEKVWNYKA